MSPARLLSAIIAGLVLLPCGLAADPPPILSAAREAVDQNETVDTRHVGSTAGRDYRQVRPEGAVLIGFEIGLGKAVNTEVIYALRPLFGTASGELYGDPVGLFNDIREGKKIIRKTMVTRSTVIQAQRGYCVSGIKLRTDNLIRALSIQFMAIDGARLDPKRGYASEWIGDTSDGTETVLGGKGKPVLGIFGRKDEHRVCSIGLVLLKHKEATVEPPLKPRPDPKPRPPVEIMPQEPPDDGPEPPPAKAAEAPAKTDVVLSSTQVEEKNSLGMWVLIGVFGLVTVPLMVLVLVFSRRSEDRRVKLPPEPRPVHDEPRIVQEQHRVPPPPLEPDLRSITTKPSHPALAPIEEPDTRAITAEPHAMSPAALPFDAPGRTKRDEVSERPRSADRSLVLFERVGFGPRFAARLVDFAVVLAGGVAAALIGMALGFGTGAALGSELSHMSSQKDEMKWIGGLFGSIFGGLVAFALGSNLLGLGFMIWEAQTGAALGKRLLKIRIKADNGATADPQQLYLRSALKYSPYLLALAGLIPGLSLLGVLSMLAGVVIAFGCLLVLGLDRQALHDMAAKTAVYPHFAGDGGKS
jgi:uncharacterized RDD family membrane protein YckC